MSSRQFHARESKTSSNINSWSTWEWNTEKMRWESHRTNSRGEIEWRSEPEGNNIDTVTNPLAPATLTSFVDRDPYFTGNIGRHNAPMSFKIFDPNYRVHRAEDFEFGRVLKVFWSEEKHGESIHVKFRRPIMSYEGRATSKPGVHAEEHAIIYTMEPKLVANENGSQMIFRPIKMISDSTNHDLDRASRINYAKTYTLEYSAKVWFIGKIDQDSEQTLRESYDQANRPLSLSTKLSVPSSHSTNNPMFGDSISTIPNILDIPDLSTPSYYPTASGYGNDVPSSTSSDETEYGISYYGSNRLID
ncbi:hypothetical protein BOTCAL_0915g00010 [Botryotinia calthae]|uniref:DUF6590 domain-containing protein n=1 Tax=Botryotinia calthae TaxID=38488 RepID=A0A4Y8CF13_9HELO|nr:hypothetical protein BOTCAL_0915g00010 [Botryotinia calthae]